MRADQHGIGVAINAELYDGQRVAARLTLLPQALSRARPEVNDAGLAGQPQRLGVHPREHEDGAALRVLDDRRDKPVIVVLRLDGHALRSPSEIDLSTHS